MSNKTWLATVQSPPFDIDLTTADIMWDLDPGWLRASLSYADGESVPAARAAVA
jgi:hypothetical protein